MCHRAGRLPGRKRSVAFLQRAGLAVAAPVLLAAVLIPMSTAVRGEPSPAAAPPTAELMAYARSMKRLHSLLVLHNGQPVIEHTQGGPGLNQPANIKSLSKTVLSALAGIAIDRGVIAGADQPLVEILGDRVPDSADRRVDRITVGHALAMQTGLRSTSGRYYGRWVQSSDWVDHILTRPFVDAPGGRMIYSSGATHLVSAALAAASGRSTLTLAREWLGRPLNISIPDWLRDPQGIHFGGNEMRLSPRALARFAEVYRQGGTIDGREVVSAAWIEASWQANGHSPWTGDAYGYGWFITELAGQRTYYGRGYGGQLLMIIPSASLTIVMTADPRPPSPGGAFFERQRALAETLTDWFVQRSAATEPGETDDVDYTCSAIREIPCAQPFRFSQPCSPAPWRCSARRLPMPPNTARSASPARPGWPTPQPKWQRPWGCSTLPPVRASA